MASSIMVGIAQALDNYFGDGYEVHIENIEQDLVEPCFLITQIRSAKKDGLGTRSQRNKSFVIQYFPKSESSQKSECDEVSDSLMEALEYITVDGDLVRGTDMSSETVDNVLNFSVHYNMRVYRVEEEEKMGSINFK